MQPRRLAYFALTAFVLVPAVAHSGRVAVLPPQLKPPGAAELRDRLHDSVVNGLVKAGDVIAAAEVRAKLAGAPDLLNCSGGPCVARAAATLQAERVVTVEVDAIGKDYAIRLTVFDAAGHALGSPSEEKCDVCTVREAARASERIADRAVPIVDKGLAHAAATAANAPPSEDEPPLHETPVRTQPPAQPAVVAAAPATRPAPAGERAGMSAHRKAAYAAFGVGAASLIAMIPFAYYASKEGPGVKGQVTLDQTTCGSGSVAACPSIYSGNTAPAVAFGVIGGVAMATGAVLLYLDWRNHRRPLAVVTGVPLPGGFAVSGSVEF